MKELPSNSNQYSIEIFSLSLTTLLTHHLPSPGQCDPGLNISLSKHHISIIPANYQNSQASQAISPCIHIWSNFTILLNLIKYVLPLPALPGHCVPPFVIFQIIWMTKVHGKVSTPLQLNDQTGVGRVGLKSDSIRAKYYYYKGQSASPRHWRNEWKFTLEIYFNCSV